MPSAFQNEGARSAAELSSRELVSYRLLLGLGGGVIVLLGFMNRLADASLVDPWSHRLAVAGMCAGLLIASFFHRRRSFRYALYAAGYLTTAWIIELLALNGFHYHFAIGLMVAVPAISTVFQERNHLLWYCFGTVVLAGAASLWITEVRIPLPTYLTQLATLCLLCYVMLGARLKSQQELAQSEERYALAAAGANDGLWDWDLTRNRIYYAPRWKGLLGHGDDEVGSDPEEWFGRVHEDDLPRLRAEIEAHRRGGDTHFEIEHRMRHRDGSFRWMLTRGMCVADEGGRVTRMAGSHTDVTARKAAEEQLLHDAFHDGLTGLPNRALFMDRLHRLVQRTQHRESFHFAVLFLDLDRFKVVNESLGHERGNAVLRAVSHRLLDGVRVEDTAARLGGDEFAVLLANTEAWGGPLRATERIHQALARPFTVDGQEVFVTASLGVAVSASGYRRGDDMMRDAETAMYRAKANGRNRYEVFDSAMHARSLALLNLESDLHRGIERGEFRAYFQPIVQLETGALTGFEALVRWHHPERGVLLPDLFVQLAEEAGLMVALGSRVLREACRQARVWQGLRSGEAPLGVAVNLSAGQIGGAGFAESVDAVLEEEDFDPGALTLEVTESVVMKDAAAAGSALGRLRERGIRISLDDFGTGYSSLSYLHRLPVDTIKIDRSFVSGMRPGENGIGGQLVQTVVALARNLGVETVAEGVETQDQWRELSHMGCDFGQGFLFSRPLDGEQTLSLLARNATTMLPLIPVIPAPAERGSFPGLHDPEAGAAGAPALG